jgi:cell wall-associated NlpC family hydrolase
MMFQRRPFISQREKALALRDAGQSRHRRDPEAARPASADGAPVRSVIPGNLKGEGTVAVRHKVGTIAGTMAVSLAFFSGTASAHTMSFNQRAASYVETFIGRVPYTYGGTSPSSGFDCSGLAQYVYRHYGKSIPRTAEAQFLRFRRESKHAAWGGDLVFFHVDSDPNSYVYHVAIYEGDNHIVSATDPAQGIAWQKIWDSDVTFGTITH